MWGYAMIEVMCWNCGEMKKLRNGRISCSTECASSILKSDLYNKLMLLIISRIKKKEGVQ